jgi:hypothetical protein
MTAHHVVAQAAADLVLVATLVAALVQTAMPRAQHLAGLPEAPLLQAAADVAQREVVAVGLAADARLRVNPRQRKPEITVKLSVRFWILLFHLFLNLWSISHEKNLISARSRFNFVFWCSPRC